MQCTINTRATVRLADIKPGETFAVEIQTELKRKASFVGALAITTESRPFDVATDAFADLLQQPTGDHLTDHVMRAIANKVRNSLIVSVIAVPAQCPLGLRTGMSIQIDRDCLVTPVAPTQPVAFAALDGAA